MDQVFSITIDWDNDDNDVCTGFSPYIYCVFHPLHVSGLQRSRQWLS
jgi:hypothetical protein